MNVLKEVRAGQVKGFLRQEEVSLISIGESLSLPPLIPTIPGVTEPLTSNAPPLPVLQVPTPPLESPPFTPSDIKPKKIGYFWTGSADKFHKGAAF